MLIPLLGLNIAKTGMDYYFADKSMKTQKKIGKAEHKANVAQANRMLAQTAEDIARGRRMQEESANARGLWDSSIRENDLAFYDRRASRSMEGARETAALAGKRMDAFKKDIKRQKIQNYLNLAFGLGNSVLTPIMLSGMAPRPQIPSSISQGAALGGALGGGPGAIYGAASGALFPR